MSLFMLGAAVAEASGADARTLQRRANEAFRTKEYAEARDALQRLVRLRPEDALAHYNLACALARLGETEAALDALEDAIGVGFINFHHMAHDKDLAPLRGEPRFQAVLLGWGELLDMRGEADLESAREALGPRYHYERDEMLRLNFASSLPAESFEAARAEIDRVAAYADARLFPQPDPDDPRADAWVTVILPTPEDFVRFVPAEGVGGIYDRDRRILVTSDIGPSLRHEFLHVLHHRRMMRLGQTHPLWVQEGLGTLVEDLEEGPDGVERAVPSWRTNIARRLRDAGRLTPWRTLFALDDERFMRTRANAQYAQARAVFMDLERRGALAEWLRNYEQTFDEDPTGVLAFERTLGAPLAQIEREHRDWLSGVPLVADVMRRAPVWLGVALSGGAGDGLVVEDVVTRPREAGERLRPRDVILSIDGRPVRTTQEVERVMGDLEPGDRVLLDVRRGTRRLSFEALVFRR
ncbi:MAG: PDZ domain-containing protein [Phycisphaerales bacterium]|nr:MAG: PDZ domain-containing protein [Phycisphaerales bacterium]